EDNVGIRVEARHEFVALMLEIRLYGESSALEWILFPLCLTAKTALQLPRRPVAHLPDPAGKRESVNRAGACAVVVATGKRGVAAYGADLQRTEGDLLCGCCRPNCQDNGAPHALG